MLQARVFVPATIGNVGPGFDVLGLAVDGLGDEVSIELRDAGEISIEVTGRSADEVPLDPTQNCAAIAALHALKTLGDTRVPRIQISRQLPIAGGLGSSAAASVGGAAAAVLASHGTADSSIILKAALEAESTVSGRHLDNIAPALFGGLCAVLSTDPPDVIRIPLRAPWWLTLWTPNQRLATREARAVLPNSLPQAEWTQQMANSIGVITAFANSDADLLKRSLIDSYAEPVRAPLISGFDHARNAALTAGAYTCAISGAGPTLFAIAPDQEHAEKIAKALKSDSHTPAASVHVGPISIEGARQL